MMKKKLLFTTKIVVSVGLLIFLFHRISLQNVIDRYAELDIRFLVVAYILLVIQYVLSTFKWRHILRSDDISMPYGFLLKTYFIGNFISFFLPSGFGGDIYRVYATQNVNQNLLRSTSSVLFDRLSGLFALLSIACISYMFLPNVQHNFTILILYLCSIFLFVLVTSESVINKLSALPSTPLRLLWKLLNAFYLYRKNRNLIILVLLISFLFQFNVILTNKIYCISLGIDIPLRYLMVIIPLIYLTEALPISINGLGVREGAFVFFFNIMGRSGDEALAVSFLLIFMRYVLGVIGGVLLLHHIVKAKSAPKVLNNASTNSS